MVLGWAGPDAIDAAAKALAAATDAPAKAAAQAKLDEVNADAGLIFQMGAIDFAGGTVVHINAGIAGLVGALLIGKRIGYGKELMPPHSLALSMVGASLLWFGWFGFNAGSNLEASGGALIATLNTFVATAGPPSPGCSWNGVQGKASLLGALSARSPLGRRHPGLRLRRADGRARARPDRGRGLLRFLHHGEECRRLRRLARRFGVHGIGGIIGAVLTRILVNPKLGGSGIVDYADGGKTAEYALATQLWAQIKAVVITLVWSGVGSAILFKIVDLLVGLRVP